MGNFIIYPSNSSHHVFSSFWRDKFWVNLGGKCLGPTKKFSLSPSLPNSILLFSL